MSTDRRLAMAALVLSAVSVGWLLWSVITSEQRIRGVAEDSIRKREDALIRELAPKLERIYLQLNVRTPEMTPQRIEELLDPLFTLLEPSKRAGEGAQVPPK